jgi:hypothetical protein
LRLPSVLERIVAHQKPFLVSVGDAAQFNATTEVSLLTTATKLAELHKLLVSAIREAGGKIQDERFIGAQYRPHITHREGVSVPVAGVAIPIHAVHMVRVLPDNECEVEQCWLLGESGEATA